MRLKKGILTLFSLVICGICFGQTDHRDVIENNKVAVANSYNKTYGFGSARQLQAAFGKVQVLKYEGEMLEHQGYIYKYKGLEVYFDGKDFDAITIKNNLYKLVLNSRAYTIGDHIIKVKAQFSASFKQRELNNKGGRCWIGIKNTDAFILITYNSKGIITEIWMGNDNS